MNKTLKRIWDVVAYSEVLVRQMPGKTEENQESTSIVTAGPLAEVWTQYTHLRSSSFCEMSVPDVSGQHSDLISAGRISIKSFFVRRSNFGDKATTLSGSVGHQSPSDGATYLRRTETAPLRWPKTYLLNVTNFQTSIAHPEREKRQEYVHLSSSY